MITPGHASFAELVPLLTAPAVTVCHDPIRGGRNILVMCEVMIASTGRPHATDTRAACARTEKNVHPVACSNGQYV